MLPKSDPRYVHAYAAIAHRLGFPVGTTRRRCRAGRLPIIRVSERLVQARVEALDEFAAKVEAEGGLR